MIDAQPGSTVDAFASARTILDFARRVRRADRHFRLGRARAIKAKVTAPFRAGMDALEAVRSFGVVTLQDAGFSRLRQFLYMWWLALRHGYSSETVYRFRLFTLGRVRPVPRFLHWEHAALLYRLVAQRTDQEAIRTIADKRRFATWCEDEGIPSPRILVTFEGGQIRFLSLAAGTDPQIHLFAKWATQYGGDETERWLYDHGRYVDQDGREYTFEQILASLAERSRQGVILLQPLLENHSLLRQLSPSALSTIRVVTLRAPYQQPFVFAAVLRMGTGKAIVDNVTQGGLISPVDILTGITGTARRYDAMHRTHVHVLHPDTSIPLEGFQIPHWTQVLQLTQRAHSRLGEIACVGWDVAILDEQPVVVEGNWNPGTKFMQVASQAPLLNTAFADVFSTWLTDTVCRVDDQWLAEHKEWSPV